MLGKIIDGQLILVGKSITNKNGITITNPKKEQIIALGYKEVEYTEKPNFNKEEEKLQEVYLTNENEIIVTYDKVALTDKEKRNILQNKVIELEQKYNMCRWQREIILAENSCASDYTKQKAQEIEELAKELR